MLVQMHLQLLCHLLRHIQEGFDLYLLLLGSLHLHQLHLLPLFFEQKYRPLKIDRPCH
uniref:Uncharacterized protein n=1 Tax=uncultured marine virus TaxID=186617 RepID=A0A0F7LBL7_9VIRU|nr:hypothetical protein [uncultured marine virus]